MNTPIPVDRLPFRVMKVVRTALMQTALSTVQAIDPPPVRLEAEILGGCEVVKRMKSPTRVQMLASICAFYELNEIIRNKLEEGELKDGITKLLNELSWVKELIEARQKAQIEHL